MVESIATQTGIDTKIIFGVREIQNLHHRGGVHTKIRRKNDSIFSGGITTGRTRFTNGFPFLRT